MKNPITQPNTENFFDQSDAMPHKRPNQTSVNMPNNALFENDPESILVPSNSNTATYKV
jgi:hypothetical protein